MKVQVTKAFRWAREGIHVIDIQAGDVVEGRPAEIALAEGWGHEFRAAPAPTESADPTPTIAAAGQPPAPPSRAEDARPGNRRRRGG